MRESVILHISLFIRNDVILTASVSLPRAKRKSENGSLGGRGAPKGTTWALLKHHQLKPIAPRERSRDPRADLIALPEGAGVPELVESLSAHTSPTKRV